MAVVAQTVCLPTIAKLTIPDIKPSLSTNCFGQSGLRSERQLIVSADESKRSSRRTSMLTIPIFEMPPSLPRLRHGYSRLVQSNDLIAGKIENLTQNLARVFARTWSRSRYLHRIGTELKRKTFHPFPTRISGECDRFAPVVIASWTIVASATRTP